MKEKILVIGGAESQCHVIDILHMWGYEIILIDYDVSCKGAEIADRFEAVSTKNIPEILHIAEKEKVRSVVSVQSDTCLITSCKVAEKMGLKTIPEKKVELFTNKFQMRQHLKKHGFFYPDFRLCKSISDMKMFAKEHGFPFVIKPLDSQGSRGVEIIGTKKDFIKLETSMAYSQNEKAVLAEEYLGDKEYTVEGIVVEGVHYTLAVSKKKHFEDAKCVGRELYYSWEEEYGELEKQHNRLIESTELPFGITHSEYIKNEHGFTLVEFAARGGGSMIASHIVPAVCGWDIEEIYMRQLLGRELNLGERTRNCAVLKFISLKIGKIREIRGLKQIKSMKNVLYFDLKYHVDDYVKPVTNDTDRHGYFIAWAVCKQELDEIIRQVENLLEVIYE